MLFNSIDFLIFFPVVVILYFLIPKKYRYVWLLAASYYFYMKWEVKYVLLLLFSTAVTYLCGILTDKINRGELPEEKKIWGKKLCIIGSLFLNLGVLGYFKDLNFLIDSWNKVMAHFQAGASFSTMEILLPVGISFYIFQAIGCTIDIYRGDVYAERNFLKYALFVSFFPQLVAGPIERSKNLLKQLGTPKTFSYENLRRGLLLMLWGYFLKMVIADRAAVIVDTVYENSVFWSGMYVIAATIFFAIQIYCDFSGYSTIARGAALVLGFELTDNFRAPYYAVSVKDFWRRWHISLTSWFRDYLYIPLGGNRKGELRKEANLLLVFSASGLWHGAAVSYILWGLLNGVYQVIGDFVRGVTDKVLKAHIAGEKQEVFSDRLLKRFVTFILIDFAWLFFRAGSSVKALQLIKGIRQMDWMILINGSLYNLGVPEEYFRVLLLSIVLLFWVDGKKDRGVDVAERFLAQRWWFRVAAELFMIFVILLFGCYGELYDTTQFIYFQF